MQVKFINQQVENKQPIQRKKFVDTLKHNFNNVSKDTCSFTSKLHDKTVLEKFTEKVKTVLIDATDTVLPGFKSRKIQNINEIAPDKLVLVHMTDYLPENGVIKTTREASRDIDGVSQYRDTVHFALNHVVYKHQFGDWNDKKVAVLAPLDGIMSSNPKGNILGGEFKDFFIKKSVKIPEGSVIVRHNPDVPTGKLRVINGEAIEEFINTKGITVLETSGSVKETASKAIEMMGYTRIDKMQQEMSGMSEELMNSTQEEIFQNPELSEKMMNLDYSAVQKTTAKFGEAWTDFVNSNGLKHYQHTASPYGRSEALIESIKLVLLKGNDWEQEMEGGLCTTEGEKVNYKDEFLKIIQEIKQSLGKDETLSFDIDKLNDILKDAVTPQDALQQIADKLKLKPMIPTEKCLPSIDEVPTDDIYLLIDGFVGISPIQKQVFNR